MNKRILIFRILAILLFVILLLRLGYLEIIKGGFYENQSQENHIRTIPIEAPRGFIFDSNGKPLAVNSISFMLTAVPKEVKNALGNLNIVCQELHLNKKEVLKKLFYSGNSNLPVILKRGMSFRQFAALSEYLPMPGIYPIEAPVRKYLHPYRDAHILGYTGLISNRELKEEKFKNLKPGDIVGQDGIERTYNQILQGKNGAEEIEVNAAGRFVKLLSEIPPKPGHNLYLTISSKLQEAAWKAVHHELKILKKRNKIRTPATVIAINPQNGQILAYVSWPSFNINWFTNGITEKEYEKILKSRFSPLLNLGIQGTYPVGSTFKMITGAAALQAKVISPTKHYECPGYYHLPGITIFCWIKSGMGEIKFPEAIAESCDVYFYRAAHYLGIKRLDWFAKAFGVGQKTGIDLPGEVRGLLPTPRWKEKTFGVPWYPDDTVNLGIGQGFLEMTPIQLAVALSAVANGGIRWQPHFFLKATRVEGTPYTKHTPQFPHKLGRVPVSKKNLAMVRYGMKLCVNPGKHNLPYATGIGTRLPNVIVAGKTGTSQVAPSASDPEGRNDALFVCFAPYQKPTIAIVVIMQESGGYGDQFALPVAKKVLEAYFEHPKPSVKLLSLKGHTEN
ncbi:MAG: penicillin-binding protein 2 [Candidatus Eremiobacteraeota bacterium]|nr:penicillin-binding protein 2 [Candidatus Eremiobacteraeota bacterium]